ncbi:hypothetical protein BU15DRAFT_45259, partial [Melanogaster broomeanus]
HYELYPHEQHVEKEILVKLKQILVHANAESVLSDTSLVPFDPGELQRMLDLVSNIQGSPSIQSPTSACALQDPAFTSHHVMHTQFLNFCGQVGARLDADKSVYSKEVATKQPISVFLGLLDFALFGAPAAHLRGAQRIWVDKTINGSRWKKYISGLNNEWGGFTIYSTVMLAVDISFLSVPGVDTANLYSQSGPTLAIYASIITSTSALIVSVLLAAKIRGNEVDSVEGGARYMESMTRSVFGMEGLAVMFSLPYALLIWG